jgi:two-component system, sensor histidine kinase LadS
MSIRQTYLLICLCVMSALSQADIMLNARQSNYNITDSIQYLFDENQGFDQFSVLNDSDVPWIESDQEFINSGFKENTLWMKLEFNALKTPYKNWNLVIPNSMLDYIDIYEIKNNGPVIIYSSGLKRAFTRRVVNSKHYVVPLKFSKNKTYLVHIQNKLNINLSLQLWQGNSFEPQMQRKNVFNWLYYGLILGLSLYNLFLFINTRHSSYLLYVVFIGATAVYFNMVDGYFVQFFWPIWLPWESWLLQLSACVSICSAGFFCSQYLGLNNNNRRFALVIQLFSISAIPAFFMMPILGSALVSYLLMADTLIVMLLSFVVSLLSLHRSPTANGLFAAAWLICFISISLYLAEITGVSFLNDWWLDIPKIGSALQALLLSFALAHRIKLLERAKDYAESKAASRSRFLAQMSHEIRTPMNGMLGMLELMRNTKLTQEQEGYLLALSNSGDLMLNLVNDILDHDRINSGKVSLDTLPMSLTAVLQKVVTSFKYRSSDIPAFNVELSDSLPDMVMGDERKLTQVLINLLSNSFKFTSAGSVNLSVNLIESTHSNSLIRFEVSDTGMGIEASKIHQVFDAFEQNGDDVSRLYGGSGLGLSICRQLADIMGFEIQVESEEHVGSRFWFELRYTHYQNFQIPEVSECDKPSDTTLNILVAEDNHVNQMVIKGFLKAQKHALNWANNGEEAVEYVRQHHKSLDLVLMDCQMPKLDGLKATQMIREFEHKNSLQALPIVAITAHVLDESEQECIEAGMNAYLSKPISRASLNNAIEAIMVKEK